MPTQQISSLTTTIPKTKTTGITGTKLMVATLAMLAAGGAALATLPLGGDKAAGVVGPLFCTDSDGGAVIETQGTMTVYDVGASSTLGSKTDYCSSTSTVHEYACKDESTPVEGDLSCKGGTCVDGACVAPMGSLTVTNASDMPPAAQLVMGTTNVSIAKWVFYASPDEDVQVDSITVNVSSSIATSTDYRALTYRNLKLFVDEVQIGSTSELRSSYAAYVTFTGLSLNIPRNTTKIVTLKTDLVSFSDMGGILTGYNLTARLINGNVTARGASSGGAITAPSVDRVANAMTIYRTKISMAWAGDTPSGSAVGGTDGIVAKFVATNSSNAGSYDATIKLLNVDLSHTGISNTDMRYLKIYKDSVTAANLLAVTNWGNSGTTNSFSDTTMPEMDFMDANIAAGSSKTFITTLDTNDAGTGDRLGIYLNTDDVVWSDGVAWPDVTEVPDSLPLSAKTLSY